MWSMLDINWELVVLCDLDRSKAFWARIDTPDRCGVILRQIFLVRCNSAVKFLSDDPIKCR